MLVFPFYRGDTVRIPLEFATYTDDTQTTTEPIDITGYLIFLTLKSSIEDSDEDAAVQVITSAHEDAEGGISEIVIPASLTGTLTPGKFYYDIQTVTPAGDVTTIECSKVTVYKDVTLVIAATETP